MESFDFIVIGGGSGGSACARRAAGYGAKVALIERGVTYVNGVRQGSGVGGTCVNVGCVPKKIMFNASQMRETMLGSVEIAGGLGYDVPEAAGAFDWAAVKARRDAYVKRLNGNYLRNWEKAGIQVIHGLASFEDSKTVTVSLNEGGTVQLTAPHILIATGGRPKMPDIPGAELAISSDGFFDVAEQPAKAAVVGSGYIGVELAGIFNGLGTETHLYIRGKTVLRRGFDAFIQETLMEALEEHGPVMHTETAPTRIEKTPDGKLTLHTSDGVVEAGFDVVLMAIGREPATDMLNLGSAGVDTERGFIKVDEYENTTAPGVYAIGDATTTGYELTPVAIAAGRRLGDRLFGGEPRARILYSDIATVVFSHPPIGTIGYPEDKAREVYGDANITVKKARFPSMLYAFNGDGHKVKTGLKLVLKGPEEKVVGLHCIGPFSDEMLQGFAVAVRMGATRRDFEAAVAIHPTIAEELVTFGGWGQKKDAAGTARPQLAPYLEQPAPLPFRCGAGGYCCCRLRSKL
uniref:Glutathione-disulfide reductase n=2 Tax=Phaeomonas parva TaxID=124430 RepID=A0A7S1XMW5_9STRA|mmetsp:Transcript_1848/g.5391  ORF Transcript_1848/g.5391 Transcript_1848/m.5391 type:complete len:519 (+) Transcript_1848:193-1749(+)